MNIIVRKLIALALTAATGLTSTLSTYIKTAEVKPEQEAFTPVLRFLAASDVHIQTYGDVRSQRMIKMLKTGYAIAEADPDYKNLDGVIFAGDNTDSGLTSQFFSFQSILKANLKDDTQPMVIIAKSHDCNTLKKNALAFFENLSGLTTDYHYVLNGFHFIGISTTHDNTDATYTSEQLAWLEEQLAAAAADGPAKPIFVAHHEHVEDTVYGSREELGEGWGTPVFNGILSKYPQVVDFSGHSHYPLNDPRSIWQGDFTAVGTASLDYFEFTVDDVRTVHPKNNTQCAQIWVVEADANNRVRLRGYDLISNNYICEYIIDKPSDKSAFAFTPEKMAANSSAPAFNAWTPVKTSKSIVDQTWSVSIPAAKSTDGKIIFIYRVTVYDASGNAKGSFWELSGYYFNPSPEKISVNIGKLEKGTYTLKCVAENAYGLQSKPVTAILTVK